MAVTDTTRPNGRDRRHDGHRPSTRPLHVPLLTLGLGVFAGALDIGVLSPAHPALGTGTGAIVRRTPVGFGIPTVALLDMPIESFESDACQHCAAGEPLAEPGSVYLDSR
jgi:hypothetical protein